MILGSIILSIPAVQTRLAKSAMDAINKDYNTNIKIDRVSATLFSWNTDLRGIYIEDYKKDTLFYIEELTTSILSIKNAIDGKLAFGDIEIDGLVFKLKTYKGERDSNLDIFVARFDSETPSSTPSTFLLTSSDIEIKNGNFKLIDENFETAEILDFKNLNGITSDLIVSGPNVNINVESLSFLDKRGLEVEKLSSKFSYSLTEMLFKDLKIATAESELKGELRFFYERKDFSDFLNKVKLEGDFKDSKIAFKELNIFYDEFSKTRNANFKTQVSGTLNNLQTIGLELTAAETLIKGDFNFKNLFKSADGFKMDAGIENVSSNYSELKEILPRLLGNILPSSFVKLGDFTIRGNTIVTEHTIDAQLNLYTAIGSSKSDLVLTNIDDIDNAVYKGFVSLINFDLGYFINEKDLGKISLDFNVDGSGFTQESLNTEVVGDVFNIEYAGYNYQDIKVSGVIKDQLFDGEMTVNDANLKLDFKGLADLSQEKNTFDFRASVAHADFRKLKITKDSVAVFKGDVSMDVVGNTINDFVGDINFNKTSYTNLNDTYFFDDFTIASSFEKENGDRIIKINSPDIIRGEMSGKFKLEELRKLAENSLGSIYVNYDPYEISEGQHIDFNFKIYNKIIEAFFPEVAFGKNTTLKGEITANEGDFKLSFRSPSINAFGTILDNIYLQIDNKNPLFNTYVEVGEIDMEFYAIKDFSLINTKLKDTLFFRTEFKGGNTIKDRFNLNLYHTFNKSKRSVLGFKKSDLTFKGNKWVLNRANNNRNRIVFDKKLDSITIDEIALSHIDEQIKLNGKLIDSTYKDLHLQFKKVSLDKITPEIENLKVNGIVDGRISVLQNNDNYLPSSNLKINSLAVNEFPLGDFDIGVVGNQDLTNYVVNAQLKSEEKESLSVIGTISTANKTPEANLFASFTDFSMEPFSPLGEDVISNIRGLVSGSAQIKGDISNPSIGGVLSLIDAGMKIPYLNADYSFNDYARVRLYDQTFDFENIILTDTAFNTSAELTGTISHESFEDWNLNLSVDTKDERFLILNKTANEEEDILYYGTGFIKGTGEIYGLTNALTIKVDAATGDGTAIKIPVSDVAAIGDYSFINFSDKKETVIIDEERKLDDYHGLELEFDLDIKSNAEVEIVVDQKSGSTIKGRGNGLLLLRINTRGKFEMFGDFLTDTGEYNYKFGGIIDKKLQVKPGGTLVWDGDPLNARINIEAVYALNANPAPLLDNSSFTRRIPTEAVISLTGELEHPVPDFSVEFPGLNSVLKSELKYRLQDKDKREQQVFSLLAQGTFISELNITQEAITGNLIQTASGLLNQVLADDDGVFNLGVSYEQGYRDRNADIRTEDRVGVTVSTQISDRVLINGKVGVPVGGVNETVLVGNIEVEILLNEEGTLSLKVFNKENEIQQFIADRQGYTQGVGLSYQVDFDSFKELFQKIFGIKKKEKKKTKTISKTEDDETIEGKGIVKFSQKGKKKQR